MFAQSPRPLAQSLCLRPRRTFAIGLGSAMSHLDDRELAELTLENVDTIYWHVGELEDIGTTWLWKARFSYPTSALSASASCRWVRLVSRERQPFSDE